MHKAESVILTNMCMIYDGSKILVQDRIKSWCGVAFPGGHVELHESFVDSVVREIKEETGLTIKNVELCGVKQWFDNNTRYVCMLYKTHDYSGTLTSNNEGKNFWIERKDLSNYKLANNFEYMFNVFDNEKYSEHYHNSGFDDLKDILK